MRKLWEVIFYPTAQVLAGFALTQHYGWAWDTALILVSLCFLSIITALFILMDALEWALTPMATPKVTVPEKPQVKINDMSDSIYAAQVPKVSIDVERAFAREIIEMWRNPLPINFTEKYWLKSGRWQSLGGVSREQFVDVLNRWVSIGAIGKRNPNAKNSPYVITSKALIVRVADGRHV